MTCLAAVVLTASSAAQAADVRMPAPVRRAPAPTAARDLTPHVNRTVFSLPTYKIVMVTSGSDTQPEKSVSGACPTGMKAVSGSANGRSTYPEPTAADDGDGVTVGKPLSLFGYPRGLSNVVSGPTEDGNGWAASGRLAPVNGDWLIELTIVCVRIPS